MTKPVRLAILMADTPLPGTRSRYQNLGNVFADLFARAVAPDPVSAHVDLSFHDIVNAEGHNNDVDAIIAAAYPDLADLDGILITGSKHSAYLDNPWIQALVAYTQRALKGSPDSSKKIRVIGVCFGHQIVGRALSSVVKVNEKGWEVSVTKMRLTPRGKELFGRDTLKIHQMHRDIVESYPPGAEPLAETDVCPIQGMLIPGQVITVQGHPEFTSEIVREILDARHDKGIFPEEVYQSGVDRVTQEHDGVIIAKAFLKFLQK